MPYRNKIHVVKKGDTLSHLALWYLGAATPANWNKIASWNGISNPNRIYVGQRIIVGQEWYEDSSGSSGGSPQPVVQPSPPVTTSAGSPSVYAFGLQSDTDNTYFAMWNWNKSNTKNFEYIWYYRTADGRDFVGSNGSTNFNESTYSPPQNAKYVKFKVKAISETRQVNNQQCAYWTSNWSALQSKAVKEAAPDAPPTPTVKIEQFTLTADIDNISDKAGSVIEFEIVKDDSIRFKTAKVNKIYSAASYSCAISAGGRYKVRARSIRGGDYSEWSSYSADVGTIPTTPAGFTTMKANGKTEIYFSWKSVKNADSYSIEYTTNKDYFDKSETQVKSDIKGTSYILTGLESGKTYFARLRANNNNGESGWSAISQTIIGSKPVAPTTWSSSTTVITGEPLILYWVHNSEDGSSETYAQLELTINGVKQTKEIKNTITDEDHIDDVKFYTIDTTKYSEGTIIMWRVRTAGITKEYGDWSILRTVDIFAPPTLELSMLDKNDQPISILESFPFYVKGLPGPATQAPIGYHVTIISQDTYGTTDRIGNDMTVTKGDEVFSKYYDINNDILMIEIGPQLVDLENNVNYILKVTVAMNSGLTAENELEFSVAWEDIEYDPSAEIGLDPDGVITYIRPYCTHTPIKKKLLVQETTDGNLWRRTDQDVTDVETGFLVSNDAYYIDENGDEVYRVFEGSNSKGTIKQYYEYIGDEELVPNILLSVYRREFDGSFTEIGTDLQNLRSTFVTDPHPALDYARYRIVAMDTTTGAISYSDTPAYPVQEKGIIIQWNEQWSTFDVDDEHDSMVEQPWSGSLLRLPYNIDVSDSHSSDVELANYIGRKHPVSYYGTQLGETSSWKVDIPMDDKDTLYALRRLAIWMEDVYVREPSGSGYWAHISVSFSQTHRETTIPVSLSLTRVEGGV